jgi:inositol phosphorylceramide mannosyltransferase catalytic subunit
MVAGRRVKTDYIAPQIDYTAPQCVRDVVASLGRTEDIRFSPSNRRLAIAEFLKNKITVFEVSISAGQNSKSIVLTSAAAISSPCLSSPHGLDFIDDERILVANRDGQACIFELPLGATGSHDLAPVAVIRSDDVSTPGSVVVTRRDDGLHEALICNNYVNKVTRHLLDLSAGYSVTNSEVLLKKWLNIPDGICVSKEKQWIAVSSHGTHAVLLYENNASLNKSSSPLGILRRITYPHGVRFTSDGRFALVADGGSPYVNIYEKGRSDWRGVRDPLLSFRILKSDDFSRGQFGRSGYNPEEGGAKGIDIHHAMNILAMTCERRALTFFDLAAILDDHRLGRREVPSSAKSAHKSPYLVRQNWRRARDGLEVSYQLYLRRIRSALRSVFWRTGVLSTRRRIAGALRAMSHPSFIRIVRYLIVDFGWRRMIGVGSWGDRLRISDREQNIAPIAKQMPPEPINADQIPKVIFQTWKSRYDIPLNFTYWRSTFVRNNPEFQCVLWDDDDNRDFIAERFAWFLPIYDGLPAGIFRADAVRPFFLLLYGGVYADMDTQCLRPLSTIPLSGGVILGQMGPDVNFPHAIPNAIMASKPFQLFWLVVIVLIMEKVKSIGRVEDIKRAGPEWVTGPVVLHEAFCLYQSESEQNIRLRAQPIIEKMPEEISARIKAGSIELLPPNVWYPMIWTNALHEWLGRLLQKHGILLAPSDARSLFPKASLVTYWTHTWEPS